MICFWNSQCGLLRSLRLKAIQHWILIFWPRIFFYLNLKRLLLTPKMSDRNLYYITNGSERLIYFSLLFFLEEAFLLQSVDNDAPRDFFCSHFKYLALLTAQLYWEVSKTEKAKASKKKGKLSNFCIVCQQKGYKRAFVVRLRSVGQTLAQTLSNSSSSIREEKPSCTLSHTSWQ